MSLTLSLHTPPEVPLEAELINPDKLADLSDSEITALPVFHGNEKTELGEFFKVSGSYQGKLHLSGDLSNIKHIGAGMADGRILIEGDVGTHVGAGMTGGEIVIEGNAQDWVGPEMTGGRIIIKGNARHMVGAAYRGSTVGMRDGEIIVFGNVGNEAGHAMRGGLIAVGGDSGDFTGVNMLAGTIVVLGQLGIRTGAGMSRGTIVSMHDAPMLPTFTYDCVYQPQFLRVYLLHLKKLGLPIDETHLTGHFKRWNGDAVELNKGEVLLLDNS